jgi:hypothetical protein
VKAGWRGDQALKRALESLAGVAGMLAVCGVVVVLIGGVLKVDAASTRRSLLMAVPTPVLESWARAILGAGGAMAIGLTILSVAAGFVADLIHEKPEGT